MDRILLLDRDGTLINDVGYIAKVKDLAVRKGVIEGLLKLQTEGFAFVVVSNQSGVARQLISKSSFERVHESFIEIFRNQGITFKSVFYCFHHPDEHCLCRKPKLQFFDQICSMYGKEQIVAMIGDSRVDAEFAENAGIKFYSTNKLQDQPLYDDFEHICQEILRESIQNE